MFNKNQWSGLIFRILLISVFSACHSENSYKPGYGEFLSMIQVHHAKLWFAGKNQNWELAAFEVSEINEIFENLQKFQSERKESKQINIFFPELKIISDSIENKDLPLFNLAYMDLTKACNNCHASTNFKFNVVIVPVSPPFTNQEFRKIE
jgi:hypothetical protein